jgi:bifunctional non-homologous end joining protein LigD
MKLIQSIRFTLTEGSSDKEYQIHLLEEAQGQYRVNGLNGRRNGTLTTQPKTKDGAVSLVEAQSIFNQLVKERSRKGYLVDNSSSPSEFVVVAKAKDATLVQLIQVIKERSDLEKMLHDDAYCLQEKKNGERRTVDKNKESIKGGNKKGETVSIPKTIADSIKVHNDIELDAEIIGDKLYLFDLLRYDSNDLRNLPYKERFEKLNSLKFGKATEVVKTAFTTAAKKKMLKELEEANAEGVVAKLLSGVYKVGREGSTSYKYKFYKTATVKVSSLTKNKRSVQMSVLNGKEFTEVGSVTIAVNQEMPKVGDYLEVRYLYAYKGGSLYQPTFLFTRDDVSDSDASIEQLEYKSEDE